MENEIIAIPTELTDAELDAVGGGHGSLVSVEVQNVLNNLDVDVPIRDNQIGVAVAGVVRQNR